MIRFAYGIAESFSIQKSIAAAHEAGFGFKEQFMMKLQRARRLDWYLGTLGSLLLAPLARLLGALMRRDHRLTRPREIVVIKLLGGGNFAIGLSAYLGIKESFPDVPLRLLTTRGLEPFAQSIGVFDEIVSITLRNPFTLARDILSAWYRFFGCDYLLDFEIHSRLVPCYTLLLCARNRFGFFCEDLFLRQHMYTHQVFFNPACNRAALYRRMARFVGASPVSSDRCQQHLSRRLSPERNEKKSRTCVGTGCSDLAKERMLSESQWFTVLKSHFESNPVEEMCFLGGAEDFRFTASIIECFKDTPQAPVMRNLCGALRFEESLRTILDGRYYIGIDSALLHFSRYLTDRVTSYWGPTDPARLLSQIDGIREEIHYRKIACSPCVHLAEVPPCRGNNLCMKQFCRETSVSEEEALENVSLKP